MRARTTTWSAVAAAAVAAFANGAPRAQELEGKRAEIAELRATDVAWRKIDWKSCLLDGIAESKRTNRPILLWIFIDRPVDDARC